MDIEATAREWTTERLKKMGVTPAPEVVDQMAADLADSIRTRTRGGTDHAALESFKREIVG